MAETTEKFTINLGVVDLGKIDLLVEQGFYANRTDFVKDAIRRTLETHNDTVRRAVARLESEGEQEAARATGALAAAAQSARSGVQRGLLIETGEAASVVSKMAIGVLGLTRHELLSLRAEGQKVRLTCVGLIVLLDDVTPELAAEVIDSVKVYGSLRCSDAVREVLKTKMR